MPMLMKLESKNVVTRGTTIGIGQGGGGEGAGVIYVYLQLLYIAI